jgi:hypothetical protein
MSETQRKFLGKGGLIALTLVIVILVVSNVWTFVSLQTQVIALEGDKNTLEDEKNTLLNYKETHSHNDSEYSNLNSEYVSAVQSYQALQDSYQTLQSDYNSLSLVYDDLQRNYEIENILRIGNSLESYYDYVRINVKPQSDLQYVNLAVNLAVHSLGENSFPTIENEFFTTVGKHSYDIAKEKLMRLLILLDYSPMKRLLIT